MNKTYTIKQVSNLTDINEILIRAWENRYNVVEPTRTESNRRLYNDEDINKLLLIKKLTDAGHRIKNIANLSNNELADLISKTEANHINREVIVKGENYSDIIQNAIQYIRNYDSRNLEILLNNSSVQLSRVKFVNNIIIPIIELIGKYWETGIFKISHEHLASTTLKKILFNYIDAYQIEENAPKLIAVTPKGQHHELGSLIGSAIASSEGWNVIYLGSSLPSEEIADVVNQTQANALFLSLIYPYDDPYLPNELHRIRNLVDKNTTIITTGKALGAYLNILNNINAKVATNSNEFINFLNESRNK